MFATPCGIIVQFFLGGYFAVFVAHIPILVQMWVFIYPVDRRYAESILNWLMVVMT